MKVFSVSGYWHADNETFEDYIMVEFDYGPSKNVQLGDLLDEEIFFYGVSEDQLKQSMTGKATFGDFEITNYKVIKEVGRK